VTNNVAERDDPSGGGIVNNGGTAILRNTIVAKNNAPAAPDVSGTFSSQGTNLIGITDGSVGFGGTDLTGDSFNPLDPLLGPLANNGGLTLTHALLSGSPAIDAGTTPPCPSKDQRGAARPQDGDGNGTQICDIGSFEVVNTPPTITNLKPAPGSEIRDRTPLIAATVRDAKTDLAKSNIQLFVDGSKKTTFEYDRIADRLLYTSEQLSIGNHAVKIVATDGLLSTTRSWSFKVVS